MNPNQQSDPNNQRDYHWKPGENPFFTQPTPDNPQQPAPGQALPTRQPEVYNSPSLAGIPNATQPAPQPIVAGGVSGSKSGGAPSKLAIAVILGIVLVVILGLVALLMSNSDSNNSGDKTLEAPASGQSQSLLPAQSIDLEQTNNAISQDMSALDDEKDFPATSLDDKTLNL